MDFVLFLRRRGVATKLAARNRGADTSRSTKLWERGTRAPMKDVKNSFVIKIGEEIVGTSRILGKPLQQRNIFLFLIHVVASPKVKHFLKRRKTSDAQSRPCETAHEKASL